MAARIALLLVALFFLAAATGDAYKKSSTAESLAIARISEALLFLRTIKPGLLHEVCQRQLQPFEVALLRAQEFVEAGKVPDALEELNVVEAGLDGCLASMSTLRSPQNFQARTRLRKIDRSLTLAEQLIQAVKTTPRYTMADFSQRFPQAATESLEDTPESVDKLFSISSPLTPKPSGKKTPPPGSGSTASRFSDAVQQYLPPPLKPNSSQPAKRSEEPQEEVQRPVSFAIDYCASHVKLMENSGSMHLDKACGAKFHTGQEYASGVFSAMIRTPVKADGVSSSFYISSSDGSISFDFYGNTPRRVSTSYRVSGEGAKHQQTFAVTFDTSAKFHKYTIKWDADSVMWLVDDVLYRTLGRSRNKPYPTNPAKLYGLIWDASHVGNGALAGTIDWNHSPFNIYYDKISIKSPLKHGSWKPPPQPSVASQFTPSPMRPLAIDYCGTNVDVGENDVSIKYDSAGCGGRFRSISRYPSGTFTARVKCASGDTSGLVSSFYLSSLEGSKDQDEIGFQWLGSNKRAVQTSFVVNGEGENEQVLNLPFDCSQQFHKYAIQYNKQQLVWLIDDEAVRTVTFSQQALVAGTPYPVKLMHVYASVRNASSVDDGKWAGKWHGRDLPYKVTFSDITVKTA